MSFSAHAYDFCVDEIYYNVTGDSSVTVTYKDISTNTYSGNVTIPEIVNYNGICYTIIEIGEYAFRYCSGLTSVAIPNSVTTIGHEAFRECSGIKRMDIPQSITSIEASAFLGCTSLEGVYISDLEAWCSITFENSYSKRDWYGC